MMKVLFVCLGNICRSPLAEAIFRKEISNQGLADRYFVDSAGTGGYHIGEPADPRSRANAIKNGVTINHRARQFITMDFQEFDYIIAMDQNNYNHITDLADQVASDHQNIHLMQSFQQQPDSLEVPDPYFGGEQGFQRVFDILLDANRGLLGHLQDRYGK